MGEFYTSCHKHLLLFYDDTSILMLLISVNFPREKQVAFKSQVLVKFDIYIWELSITEVLHHSIQTNQNTKKSFSWDEKKE